MSSISAQLSKSSLIRFLQCPKSLYLYKHHYNLRTIPDAKQQQKFDRGIRVGKLAQKLFPNGKDCTPPSPFQYAQSVVATAYYIQKKEEVIYEATFKYLGILIALDILVFKDGKYYAYEVKSSLSISNTYILDCAIQYYTIRKCGIEIENFFIIYVNDKYVRKDILDINQLFTEQSVLKQVLAQQPFVEEKIKEAFQIIQMPTMPEVSIGTHCNKPYPCDFKNYCWQNVPQNSIWNLQAIALNEKLELIEKGIHTIDDYAQHNSTNLLLNAYQKNEPIINKEKIKEILNKIQYPVAFFDVEAFQSAIPIFNHTKPYERIPFLYSLHMQIETNSNLEHHYFLSKTDRDYRLDFLLDFLEKTKNTKTIIVFNELMEKGILNYLANLFPQHNSAIQACLNKILDIEIIFKNYFYYHPKQLGSLSLKTIASSVLAANPYKTVGIRDGEEAMAIYNELFFKPEKNKDFVYNDLIKYCYTDTYALYLVCQHLLKITTE